MNRDIRKESLMRLLSKSGGVAAVTLLTAGFAVVAPGAAQNKSDTRPVTITEDATTYTLANGVVTARIDKNAGDLLSMKFKDLEMLATIYGADGLPNTAVDKPGANLRGGGHRYTDHQYGFWSHDTE